MNTINNKEEYLKYRSEWKLKYKELSKTIRDAKFANKYWATTNPKKRNQIKDERYGRISIKLKQMSIYDINRLSYQATQMLEELKQVKIQANNNYIQNKSLVNN